MEDLPITEINETNPKPLDKYLGENNTIAFFSKDINVTTDCSFRAQDSS